MLELPSSPRFSGFQRWAWQRQVPALWYLWELHQGECAGTMPLLSDRNHDLLIHSLLLYPHLSLSLGGLFLSDHLYLFPWLSLVVAFPHHNPILGGNQDKPEFLSSPHPAPSLT